MNTNSKTPKDIKDAFVGLFDNRTEEQKQEDAAQLLSFRFLSEVERLMNERGLTRRQLATMAGLSASYITQLFRGDRLVNMDMLARFERILDIQFVTGVNETVAVDTPKLKSKANSSAPSRSPVSARL